MIIKSFVCRFNGVRTWVVIDSCNMFEVNVFSVKMVTEIEGVKLQAKFVSCGFCNRLQVVIFYVYLGREFE